jgi:hypothetical protein
MECAMSNRIDRLHPAIKHGAYSATDVLPGESRAAFEKLHRDLIAEYAPSGVHEHHIVTNMARLIWRKQNLMTLHIANLAEEHRSAIRSKKVDDPFPTLEYSPPDPVKYEEQSRAAEDLARKELGETYELIEVGRAATFDGLTEELDIQERLDAAINRCLKQLLMVRGVKSVTAAPPSAAKRISDPSKAA